MYMQKLNLSLEVAGMSSISNFREKGLVQALLFNEWKKHNKAFKQMNRDKSESLWLIQQQMAEKRQYSFASTHKAILQFAPLSS